MPTLPKRYLNTAEVCHVYGCTPDYLESVSVADLPRNKRGHRTVLYDVIDCERHFASFRIAGDEGSAGRRELPTALPVAVHVSAA
ncbi:hypothetical protein rosag_15430 [Roseisolibacter agri]|uniref:Uncharacterized protein n=1 Tax=Roseisolibacter agri TaxID=2014610 RepID=A0AA37V0R7_9BACT|nr:hypothetical protein rosag_15430 [Roseisolibacter agri]